MISFKNITKAKKSSILGIAIAVLGAIGVQLASTDGIHWKGILIAVVIAVAASLTDLMEEAKDKLDESS